jgi:hypothetical protein
MLLGELKLWHKKLWQVIISRLSIGTKYFALWPFIGFERQNRWHKMKKYKRQMVAYEISDFSMLI